MAETNCPEIRACIDINIYTCASCTGYWIHATCTNKCLHHFVHATLNTTAFPVYPLLTTSTLYWIITNASTTDTTWPCYSFLLTFCHSPLIITLVLFIFILMPPFSTKSFHSLSLLIRSSSVSAITTRSYAYNTHRTLFTAQWQYSLKRQQIHKKT